MTHCLFFMEASWEDLAFIPTDLDVGYFFTYRAKHTGPSSAGCMFFAFVTTSIISFLIDFSPLTKEKKNKVRKLIFFSHYTNRKSTADLKIRRSQQGFVCVCATLLSGVGKF